MDKIQISLFSDKIDGEFTLAKDQIQFNRNGQFWYTDVDSIINNGMNYEYDSFGAVIDIPPDFNYNEFYCIMLKLIVFSGII